MPGSSLEAVLGDKTLLAELAAEFQQLKQTDTRGVFDYKEWIRQRLAGVLGDGHAADAKCGTRTLHAQAQAHARPDTLREPDAPSQAQQREPPSLFHTAAPEASVSYRNEYALPKDRHGQPLSGVARPHVRPAWVAAAQLEQGLQQRPYHAGAIHDAYAHRRRVEHLQATAREALRKDPLRATAAVLPRHQAAVSGSRAADEAPPQAVRAMEQLVKQNEQLHGILKKQAEQLAAQERAISALAQSQQNAEPSPETATHAPVPPRMRQAPHADRPLGSEGVHQRGHAAWAVSRRDAAGLPGFHVTRGSSDARRQGAHRGALSQAEEPKRRQQSLAGGRGGVNEALSELMEALDHRRRQSGAAQSRAPTAEVRAHNYPQAPAQRHERAAQEMPLRESAGSREAFPRAHSGQGDASAPSHDDGGVQQSAANRRRAFAALEADLATAAIAQENIPSNVVHPPAPVATAPAPEKAPEPSKGNERLDELESRVVRLLARMENTVAMQSAAARERGAGDHDGSAAGAPVAPELTHLELLRLTQTVQNIERSEREIYARWFTPEGDQRIDGASGEASSCAPRAIDQAGATLADLDSGVLTITARRGSEDASLPRGAIVGDRAEGTEHAQAQSAVLGEKPTASGYHDADALLTPKAVAKVLEERNAFLQARAESDALLAIASGADAGSGFDPISVVEAVADAVIDDLIEEHVDDMLRVADNCVDVMFAQEFAQVS